MPSSCTLVVVVAMACAVHGAIPGHEITSLPGWDGALPSKQYSGYLPVTRPEGTAYYHYWFVESMHDPTSDPVALWLNGGPGSSSLIGFFTENGPFTVNINSLQPGQQVPKLFLNPYAWNNNASFIFLESPAGVGFSYCDFTPCHNNDTTTAVDNYAVLKAFFAAYPEFSKQDFYITGESYAGIYCPTLAEQIMNDPQSTINLKGLAVGNGCWGNQVGTCAFGNDAERINIMALNGRGAISQTLFAQITAACTNWNNPSAACRQALRDADDAVGSYNVYNYYDECGSEGTTKTLTETPDVSRVMMSADLKAILKSKNEPFGAESALNDYACGGEMVMGKYLALPEVATAIHVKTGTAGMSYSRVPANDLRPLYNQLAQKYRLVIYSGDADQCVPYYGSEEWTYALGFNVSQPWRAWQAGSLVNASEQLVAGYVTKFGGAAKDFSFITVKGAGHMVPEFKPVEALAMITRFFYSQPF